MSSPYLALDVGGTSLRLGTIADGQVKNVFKTDVVNFLKYPHLAERELKQKLVDQIVSIVLVYQEKYVCHNWTALFVSFAGPVSKAGEIRGAPTIIGPMKEAFPLGDLLREKLCKQIYIINDLSAAAYKYAQRYNDPFMVLTVSSGIGNKVVWKGELLIGDEGEGGELGHFAYDLGLNASRCDCGHFGHLGAVSSARGVERHTQKMAQDQKDQYLDSYLAQLSDNEPATINTYHIVAAAKAGDAFTLKCMEPSLLALAHTISFVYHAIGVGRYVLIGGFVHALGELYIELLKIQLRKFTFFGQRQGCDLPVIERGDEEEECLVGLLFYSAKFTFLCGDGAIAHLPMQLS